MWEIKDYGEVQKRAKKLKKHRQELINVFANLGKYLDALRSGLLPQQVIRSWARPEPCGLRAIDESGPKNPKKPLRLYVYPEVDAEILHILTLGDKDSQSDDIKQCEEFVEDLIKAKAKANNAPTNQKADE